ncbi:MAG: hypothetical protein R3B69_02075 [Candidatus Paceibacterota bacterium]
MADDGSIVVSVSNTITYTLTVSNAQGSDTCTAKITVDDEPNDDMRCDSFTADDYNGRENDRVTLTWKTTGATSASISPDIGSVPVDGSTSVVVEHDTTYTLTISDGSTSKTSVSIDTESGGGGGGGSSSSRCDLDISDKKVKAGEKVTLAIPSRTNEIEIEDNHGKTIFESDDDDYMDGEIDVIVYKDTEFRLIAEKGSKKNL